MSERLQSFLSNRQQQLLLGITCVVLLVGGVLAAVSNGDDGDDASEVATEAGQLEAGDADPLSPGEATDATTDTTVAGADPAADGAGDAGGDQPADPGVTPGDGGTTPTSTKAAAPEPAEEKPKAASGQMKPVAPTRAGTYVYRTTTTDEDGNKEQSEDPSTYRDVSRQGGVVVQELEQKQQDLDSVSRIQWDSQKLLVLKTDFEFGGNQAECDWKPDHVQAVFPIKEGLTHEASSQCQIDGFGPTPVTVKRKTTSKVIGAERITVAGQEIDVWRFQGTERIEFQTVVINIEATSWFSPERGLVVRTKGEASGDAQGGGPRDFESVILNLDPR